MNETTTITLGLAYVVGAGIVSAIVTYFTANHAIDTRVTKIETRLDATVASLKESIDLLRGELRQYYQRRQE